jgi:hypothetical protein
MGKQFHFALLVLGEAHDQLYPGGSSLMDRGVYDAALSEAEYLARVGPRTRGPTVQCANGARRGIIFFAATKVRILPARHIEQPAVMPFSLARTMPAEILVAAARGPRRSSNANRLCCAIFGQIGRNSPAIRADFDPNGFRSSSPTTRATQSVSPMYRNASLVRADSSRRLR